MIRFGFQVDVARPPEEVFAYVTDPRKLPEWQGTHEIVQLTEGRLGKGTRLREVRTVLGRQLESITEVAEYERDRRFGVRILSGPAPIEDRWAFEPTDGGTRVHFSAEGRAAGVLRAVEPLLAVVLRRRRQGHHARLKQALERRRDQP